ncbi:class I SAM-dependent methyltransferase [Roseivirga sp.]|uniref:class I SAM-dependent methyltransferase n=1 Tax=Roseivirga sp. TaxID=1964215 RepID=UPI003B8B96EC
MEKHIYVKDHFGTKEDFLISKCKTCNTLYTDPRPKEETIVTYYKSGSYVSHGDKVNPLFNSAYSLVQRLNFKFKKKILNKYTLSQRHLDYGAGNGAFLSHLKASGWAVDGIEPDEDARASALKKHGITLNHKLADLASNTKYTSISLFHVLEHVHQLEQTMEGLISRLDNNGVILLALPNFKSHDAEYYGNNWAGYDVPRHLYHFSQKSIHQLSKRFGLNIVATHPMKFDSYYVSLLSEEYKTGRKKYLSSILKGYQSNRKAKRTGEYSSLIYILSK